MQTDKRIVKTRTNIKRAFMELVEEREINKISVSDLAAKAYVNRSTFYLHYPDVTAVAAEIEKEIADSITLCLEEFSIEDIYSSTLTLFRTLTKRLDEYERLKRYIIFSTNSDYVIARLKDIFVEKTISSIKNTFPHISEKDINFQLVYAAAGTVDCYVKWVREKGGSVQLEELIKKVSEITEHIISTITNG